MPEYEVIGSSAFNGNEPGSTFTADLPEDQEARAIARGSIKKVGTSQATQVKQAETKLEAETPNYSEPGDAESF